jgi:hypothetical protein
MTGTERAFAKEILTRQKVGWDYLETERNWDLIQVELPTLLELTDQADRMDRLVSYRIS